MSGAAKWRVLRRTRWPEQRESREQEQESGAPLDGGLDFLQEGRVSLPSSSVALSRLALAFIEAAVEICNAALAAAGGRDSPAASNLWSVPSLRQEAQARAALGISLHEQGEERQRCLELMRSAVKMMRQVGLTLRNDDDVLNWKWCIAQDLGKLAGVLDL